MGDAPRMAGTLPVVKTMPVVSAQEFMSGPGGRLSAGFDVIDSC